MRRIRFICKALERLGMQFDLRDHGIGNAGGGFSDSIFPAAVPLPPETIAPAWPIRRPGGAVTPAIKAATGFLQFLLIHSAASSSAEPPISPIKIIASVPGSSLKSFTQSRCDKP